jgi:hypothetical protein
LKIERDVNASLLSSILEDKEMQNGQQTHAALSLVVRGMRAGLRRFSFLQDIEAR